MIIRNLCRNSGLATLCLTIVGALAVPVRTSAQNGEATEGGVRGAARITHFFKHHSVATKLIVAGVASGVYAEGLHQCRLGGVENCQAHYGAAWGSYGATVVLDLVAQLVGQKIGGKTGNAIAYGGSAGVLGWGAYQWHGGLNKPKEGEHEAGNGFSFRPNFYRSFRGYDFGSPPRQAN